jgi:subtilase family serine protease
MRVIARTAPAAAVLLLAVSPAVSSAGGVSSQAVSPTGLNGARCLSMVVTTPAGVPLTAASPDALPAGMGPAQFHAAYALPNTTSSSHTQTIAIVDAFDDPTIESDLATYSSTFGLPPCTTANGCFRKVNQLGGTAPLPAPDGGWALEIALDVETVHAICQDCKILLVEATTNLLSDLQAAVNTAASLGATQISNSYGGSESSSETGVTAYRHSGIAITASSGDSGFGTSYPAADPGVIAVGGTTLTLSAGGGYGSERVWNGAGSGCSRYEPANSFQRAAAGWSATRCSTKRGIADVAADADPNTGAAVYDSTPYPGSPGHPAWWQVGGTSLSAPLIAAVYGLAANNGGLPLPASTLYAQPGSLHDVTTGKNGGCGSTMCKGAPGYDGPTGLGTPNGLAAF